ncbi:MAG: hypothetical protein JOZ78_07145 [Chroococcidiopsidaceae cyanobacterium CP_BM_ER_R8_30]|nr:hypothetical protein [Chroococcidiopsidaceae cyanobacterium CP_BM_ER_R8_30]
MIFDLDQELIVALTLVGSILWLLVAFLRVQRALQWWSRRQSIYLLGEAKKIQDGLLQESFALRRSLEQSLVDDIGPSAESRRDWLKQIEKFYHDLEQLSDRLSPAYIEDSLPLGIQSLLKLWQTCHPLLKIEMELPGYWRHEPPDRSLIILRALDELLQITSSELLTEILIRISLKSQGDLGELIVHISYPDKPTLVCYSNLKELEYLSQSFRILTSGKCFRRKKELKVTWYFQWVSQLEP